MLLETDVWPTSVTGPGFADEAHHGRSCKHSTAQRRKRHQRFRESVKIYFKRSNKGKETLKWCLRNRVAGGGVFPILPQSVLGHFSIFHCRNRRSTNEKQHAVWDSRLRSRCDHLANSKHTPRIWFCPFALLCENMTSSTKPEVHSISRWGTSDGYG